MRPQLMSVMWSKPSIAVEIDERTEIGDVLDHALADLARLDRLKEVATLARALLFDELATGENDVFAFEIDFEDLEVRRSAHVLIEVLGRLDIDVRGREEGIDTDRTIRPPLTLAFTRPAAMEPSGNFVENVIPVFLLLSLVEGQHGGTALVFEFFDENVDAGADLEFA